MDVTITGKALAPLPFHSLSPPQSKYEANPKVKQIYLPLSRQWSDTKSPMQLLLESKLGKDSQIENASTERSRLNLTPAFRNMTLSETYSFARAQLRAYPVHHMYQRRNVKTPTLSFTKAEQSSNTRSEQEEQNKIETSRSEDIPHAPCRRISENPEIKDSGQNTSESKPKPYRRTLNRRHAKSACGLLKTRRKSGRKKKHNSPLTSRANLPENPHDSTRLPIDLPVKGRLLPPKTQSSVVVLKNVAEKQKRDQAVIFSHHSKASGEGNLSSASEGLKLPRTQNSMKRNNDMRIPDSSLLMSLDTSSSDKERHGKHLAMRIQLIHRYGNEDVIGKHMELQRKKEAADRHERKNLEHQANEKLKEIQRSKIYALNALMTRLEQEQFEEYKQSINS